MAFGLNIDTDVGFFVWPHENVEDLFTGPQPDRFPYSRRRNVYVEASVSEVAADLCELAAVKESIFQG